MKRQLLSFREMYEIIEEVKASVSKGPTLRKYRITDRLYNRVIDSKPEVPEKVKKCEFEKINLQYMFRCCCDNVVSKEKR